MSTDRLRGLGGARTARECAAAFAVFVATLALLPVRASAQTAPSASAAPSAATAPAEENASPAALMFGKKCGGCHTLGGGDRTGPDLIGVTKRRDRKWISTFVRTPGAVIDSGDATANDLLGKFKNLRMPDQQITDEEMEALLAYLEDCTAKGSCKIATGKIKKASEANAAEIELGRKLFEGSVPLANGGAACISCHNVRGAGPLGGGTLAKDLTFVYARLGDNGLSSALATTPFPLMKDIYAKKALRDSEQYALKAYLYSVHRDGTAPQPDHDFLYVGFLGLGASLGLMGAVWSSRMRGGIRQRIVHPNKDGKNGKRSGGES